MDSALAAARTALTVQSPMTLIINGVVILVGAIVAIVSFAFLIPLDSVPAVTGVTIIVAVSYAISIVAWVIVLSYYSRGSNENQLVWLLTHMMFFVVLPATIAATAMNVTAVQNTRNLLAGKIAA
jgi:hypothetical protein